MSAKRRAVAPLLTLQALVFVVITVAMGAIYSIERATYDAQVDNPSKQLRHVRSNATRALALPYAVAATRDEGIAQEAKTARLRAEQGLEQLESSIGDIRGSKAAIADALRSLTEARHLLASIEAASPDTRLTNAFSELAAEQAKLDDALTRIEVRAYNMMAFHYDFWFQILLALWVAALIAALTTGLSARSRTQANNIEAEERTNRAIDGLTRVVRQALDEEEIQHGLLPSREPYAVLGEATGRLVAKVEGLLKANREMARSNNFLQELQEALSLAEDEQAVLQTAVRAAGSTNIDKGLEIINIDSSNRSLRITAPNRASGGESGGDGRDDATSLPDARSWHDSIDNAIQRSPAEVQENICVTVIAQMSRNEAKALRFDELEALALATAVRLSATRREAQASGDALTDPLTGLPNRRDYRQRMDELDKAGIGYTLVMADLDHFKQLNDQFGHDVGDQCLEIFSQVLKDACRGSDLPCRLGGEEFVLVLPGVGVKAGLAVALRVRSYLARAAAQGPAPFTVSLGVASSPDHGTSADAVLRAADAALFDAKEAGRDQVVPARMQTNLEAAR